MAGIVIELTVDDKGTVKIKQFSDEAKKAFEEMKKGPEQAKAGLKFLDDAWVAVTAKVALATAAFYTAKRMIYDTGKEMASMAMEIEKQSNLVGMSTDTWQKWAYAAHMSDVQQQEFVFGLRLLSRNMEEASAGSGDAAKWFSAMGLSVKDTAGHLRPLNDVMLDIMDKFASWEDGPKKIAIALALFGRGGEAMVPLLNKGKVGFREFSTEAERFNFILGKDVVKSLSESEDIFKRWTMTWKVAKMEIFAPLVDIFGSILERVMALRRAWGEGGIKGVYQEILAGQEEERIRLLTAPAQIKKWAWEEYIPAGKGKPPLDPDNPFGIEGFSLKKIKEQINQLRVEGAAATFAAVPWGGEALGLRPGEMEIEGVRMAIKDYELLAQKIEEYNNQCDYAVPTQRQLFEIETRSNDLTISRTKSVLDLKEQIASLTGNQQELIAVNKAQEDFFIATNNLLPEQIELYRKLGEAQRQQMTEGAKFADDTVNGIINSWSSVFSQMRRSGQEFGDWFKNMWLDIADTVIGQIMKIMAQEALLGSFKNVGGAWSSGGISGGLIGLVGSIFGAQEGFSGWVNKPTAFLAGEGGEKELVNIVPQSKMGGGTAAGAGGEGNVTVFNYIQVNDPNTFVRLYGPVVKKLSEQTIAEVKRFSKMAGR